MDKNFLAKCLLIKRKKPRNIWIYEKISIKLILKGQAVKWTIILNDKLDCMFKKRIET